MARTMRFRGVLALIIAGSLATLSGCEGTLDPGEVELTSDDAAAIAGFLSDVDLLSVGLATLSATSGTRTLSRTASCPAGGSVSVSGSSESTRNDETRVVSTKWTTTKTSVACAISHTRGDKTATAVVDGSVTTSGTSAFQLPATRDGQRTLLSWASATAGSTTTKVGDRSSTCAVDVKETYDPATKTFTVVGVMCGRQVNVTRGLGR